MFISCVNRLKVIYKGINKIVETFGNGVSLFIRVLYKFSATPSATH